MTENLINNPFQVEQMLQKCLKKNGLDGYGEAISYNMLKILFICGMRFPTSNMPVKKIYEAAAEKAPGLGERQMRRYMRLLVSGGYLEREGRKRTVSFTPKGHSVYWWVKVKVKDFIYN